MENNAPFSIAEFSFCSSCFQDGDIEKMVERTYNLASHRPKDMY